MRKVSRKDKLDSLEIGESYLIKLTAETTIQKIFNHNTAIYAKVGQKFNYAGLTQSKVHIVADDQLIIAVMVTRVKESSYN